MKQKVNNKTEEQQRQERPHRYPPHTYVDCAEREPSTSYHSSQPHVHHTPSLLPPTGIGQRAKKKQQQQRQQQPAPPIPFLLLGFTRQRSRNPSSTIFFDSTFSLTFKRASARQEFTLPSLIPSSPLPTPHPHPPPPPENSAAAVAAWQRGIQHVLTTLERGGRKRERQTEEKVQQQQQQERTQHKGTSRRLRCTTRCPHATKNNTTLNKNKQTKPEPRGVCSAGPL